MSAAPCTCYATWAAVSDMVYQWLRGASSVPQDWKFNAHLLACTRFICDGTLNYPRSESLPFGALAHSVGRDSGLDSIHPWLGLPLPRDGLSIADKAFLPSGAVDGGEMVGCFSCLADPGGQRHKFAGCSRNPPAVRPRELGVLSGSLGSFFGSLFQSLRLFSCQKFSKVSTPVS